MNRARPLTAAEQIREKEQQRVEHRQSGQHQKHKTTGGDPVVDAARRGVADDGSSGIGHLDHFAACAGRFAEFNRRCASASSSGCTSFGPTEIQWKKPASAVNARPANATGLMMPFQRPTKALIWRFVRS